MKRQGFVSNSSSSSFVLVTTKENHERALGELHPYVVAIMKKVCSEGKFLGRDVMYVGDMEDMGGISYTFEYIDIDYDGEIPIDEWDNEMSPSRAYDVYEKKVEENPKEVFSWGIS